MHLKEIKRDRQERGNLRIQVRRLPVTLFKEEASVGMLYNKCIYMSITEVQCLNMINRREIVNSADKEGSRSGHLMINITRLPVT